MKTISIREFAAIKRAAMDVAPLSVKKQKISQKIVELGKELQELNEQIIARQGYIKTLTGLTTDELVIRTVESYLGTDGTPKVDKNGRPLTITKYSPNPTHINFNETTRQYEVCEVENIAEDIAEDTTVNIVETDDLMPI